MAQIRRRPLDGVRVLAVEQYGAGPWATLQLADLGAEVIKIEDPASGGDIGRYVPPFQAGEDSLFFETFNRNKKSLSLDLRHPDAGMYYTIWFGPPTLCSPTCVVINPSGSG